LNKRKILNRREFVIYTGKKLLELSNPDLSRDEILRADAASVAAWDSLATVTLIAVIEEEFGVEIAPENLNYRISLELAR
jgi:acyl carrier protein